MHQPAGFKAGFVPALLVALTAFATPGSLPELDDGGGRAARPLQAEAALRQAKRAGLDIGGVIETVRHHVAPVPRRPGLLRAEDRFYRVELGSSGFALSMRAGLARHELAATRKAWRALPPREPREPGARTASSLPAEAIPFQAGTAFRIETRAVTRGRRSLAVSSGPWRGDGTSAVRGLAPGLEERVIAGEGRLEWELRLAHTPAGSGPLTIGARVSARGQAMRLGGTKPGWRFPAGAGRSVHLGALVVRDGRGRDLYRALPELRGNELSLTVPERILRGAAYPLTIDPVVRPEYRPVRLEFREESSPS